MAKLGNAVEEAKKEVEAAEVELKNIKEQRNQYLKEYGMRVSDLDKRAKNLADDIASKQNDLKKMYDDSEQIERQNKKLIEQAKEEAKEIINQAIKQSKESLLIDKQTRQTTLDLKEKYQELFAEYKEKINKARDLNAIANDNYKESESKLKDVENQKTVLAEMQKEIEKVKEDFYKKEMFLIGKQEDLEVELAEVKELKNKLEAQKVFINNLKNNVNEDKAILENNKKEFEALKLSELKKIEDLKQEVEEQRRENIKTAEANAIRSKELDYGLAQQRQKEIWIKQEMKKLEAIKKEVIK